jgi:NAD+ kinase
MSTENLPKLVILGDPQKGNVAGVIKDFTGFVKSKAQILASSDIENCPAGPLKDCDYAVVFGGDGSIISAARVLAESGVPVIGVNLGKLGFLAEFSLAELKGFFDRITRGEARIEKRMMLGCAVHGLENCGGEGRLGERKFHSAAVNDVFVTAGPPFRMIELKVSVDGQNLAGCVSDGLVICTPTGSTAYNLSAAGPILAANMEAMVITPICPHSLSFRPIVIRAESRVEVFGVRLNAGSTVSVDGQVSMKLTTGDVVVVERTENVFHVVNNPLRNHWDTLAAKLSWAEKPKYTTEST